MNRKELITKVAEDTGFKEKAVEKIVLSTFKTIQDSIVAGESVNIYAFGTFERRERAPKNIYNPGRGKMEMTPGKKIPYFKASGNLKDAVKKG